MGCIVILLALAIMYGIDCLLAWGILACLAFFGVPIEVGAAQIYVGALLILLVTIALGGFKVKFK
jgi:hypothetical protein